jgi:hypothetical protein
MVVRAKQARFAAPIGAMIRYRVAHQRPAEQMLALRSEQGRLNRLIAPVTSPEHEDCPKTQAGLATRLSKIELKQQHRASVARPPP